MLLARLARGFAVEEFFGRDPGYTRTVEGA